MEDDWEHIADGKQIVPPAIKPNVNKWDGEDEEDDVKESWEEEEEEKKDEEKNAVAVKTKPKKSLAEKIAEKEKLKQEEMERKRKLLEEEYDDDLTPEERMAEKLRLQKLQEEADLKTALETLGITEKSSFGIDAMNPTTKTEFTEFSDAISKKVSQFKIHSEYPVFVEELVRSVCAHLNSTDLRKVKGTLDNLYLEKQKFEKAQTKKGKSKGKAGLRVERNDATNAEEYGYGDYDYDDFM